MLSDAFIVATCNKCSETVEIELTALAKPGAYDMREVESNLEREGWVTVLKVTHSGNEHYCSNCVEEM